MKQVIMVRKVQQTVTSATGYGECPRLRRIRQAKANATRAEELKQICSICNRRRTVFWGQESVTGYRSVREAKVGTGHGQFDKLI